MLQKGEAFGRYVIGEVLGSGGMGQVYQALDTVLHRHVALKLLVSEQDDPAMWEEAKARMLREARASAALQHPNAVAIYDLGTVGDAPYIAMELVPGQSLRAYVGDTLVPWERKLRWMLDVAAALAAAHTAGLVHRDVKPENVMVRPDGQVKVLDFGIARRSTTQAADAAGPANAPSTQITGAGTVLGTPRYMPLEQIAGKALDGRTDQFAWAVTAYELLTGTTPWSEQADPMATAAAMLTEPPKPLFTVAPEVPLQVAQVIERALSRQPGDRFATMEDVIAALDPHAAPFVPPSAASNPMMSLRPSGPRPPIDPFGATQARPETAKGVATDRARPTHRRSRRRSWGLSVALAAVALTGVGAVVVRARLLQGQVPAASTSSAALPAVPAVPTGGKRGPTPVLVLGIENLTPDPTLDGTLDAVLESALRRSTAIDPFAGAKLRELEGELDAQPQSIDEGLGRRLAAASGGTVITVRGSAAATPGGLALTVRATDAVTGAIVFEKTVTTDAGHVVSALGELACALRRAAGDASAPTDPELAGQTGLSASIDADHEWTVGVALNRSGKYADAQTHLERAVVLDPDFPMARDALGLNLWNQAQRADGDAQFRVAFKWVDRMGERDRLGFLGDYYGTVGDYDRSVDAYRKLLEQWPGDGPATINLAVTYQQAGDDAEAVKAGRVAADAHPHNALARSNMTNFYLVASQFEDAVRDGAKVLADFPQPPVSTFANIAAADILLGHRSDAIDMLRTCGTREPQLQTFGLADLALYEGRLLDAAKLLDQAVVEARAQHDDPSEPAAWAYIAQVRLRLGDKAGAIAAGDKAARSEEMRIQLLAALALVDAGRPEHAAPIAARLASSLVSDERAAGKLVSAETLRVKGKAREAIAAYQEAMRVRESWLGHFGLAVAYLDARAFAEAYSEIQTCIARRGEAANYWLPSVHLISPAYYYLARAQEGLGNPEAAATYGQFLALEPEAQGDALADDARRRLR